MLTTNLVNKIINASYFDSLSFTYIQGKKVLILQNNTQKKYFLIPIFINCSLNNTNLVLSCSSFEKRELAHFNLFHNLICELKKPKQVFFKKKLKLKGLGFRIALSPDFKYLELKLGFSHLISLLLPLDIKVTIQKNICIIEGLNKVKVGNFVSKIHSLKIPDDYKGKGFWYSNQIEKLKVIKKK